MISMKLSSPLSSLLLLAFLGIWWGVLASDVFFFPFRLWFHQLNFQYFRPTNMNVSERMHRDFIILIVHGKLYYIWCIWPISKFIYCSTAKLLERQIERERARKVDEVCLEQKCLLIISIVSFKSLVNTHFFMVFVCFV